MKPKNTLLLIVILVLLCAAYWGKGYFQHRQTQEIQAAKQLFDFKAESVKSITLKRVDGPECAGERQPDGTWKITEPNATIQPMPLVWDRMAAALAGLTNQRNIVEAPADLGSYGLAEPRLKFSATIDGHDPVNLVFGSPEPTQVSRFARLNDGPVMLINEKQFFELDRDLDFLRYRFLVDNREAPLNRIEYVRIWTGREAKPPSMPTAPAVGEEGTRIIVERSAASEPWRMLQPVNTAANVEAVEALAKELQFALAEGFVDAPANLADYGLEPPNARIVIRDANSATPQTILLGDADKTGKGRLFAKREGKDAVFTLDGTLIGKLPRTPEEFRERRMLTQQAKDITRLDYRSNATSFAFTRDKDNAWQIEGAVVTDITQERTNGFLQTLKEAAVQTFADNTSAEAVGLNTPDVSIRITLKDDPTPRELRLKAHPTDAAMFYAQQDTGAIGMMTAERAKLLMVSPESFRSLALLTFNKNEATKISFTIEQKFYEFEKVHDLWVVRQPENYRLSNQSDAEMILAALSKLIAADNAAVQPPGADDPGVTAPALTITVTTTGTDGTNTTHGPLNIGKPLPGKATTRYCTIAGREGLFTVPQTVVDKIRDALHGVIANPK